MKQTVGYIVVNNRKILVLVRHKKYGRTLKYRASGQDGIHLADEESYLEDNPDVFRQFLISTKVEL